MLLWHNHAVQRKNQPGYVRVPLKRSNRRGGTSVAHYWMRSGVGDPSGARAGVQDLGVDLDELDADDILAQEVIYAFEGEKPTWHKPADGFAPELLARTYGDRFADADIVHVAGVGRDFYCLAAHGTASLVNAINKEILPAWADDEDTDVEQATALLVGFTNWSELRRHGVVPIDQKHDDAPLLPSITVNGQTPIRGRELQFESGDVIERDRLDRGSVGAALRRWEETGDVDAVLSDAVHEYAGAIPTTKLHRAVFLPDRAAWLHTLKEFEPGDDWGIEGDVTDFYADRHHSFFSANERPGEWVIRFEVFGLEGVPAAQLADTCSEDETNVRNGEWLIPGPLTTGVLRVDVNEADGRGYAVVYLLAD